MLQVFLSAKSIQKCQSIPQDVFWMFHNLSKDVIDMSDVSATPAGGIGSCERRASKCLQGHAVFIVVWRLDNLKESLKLETNFVLFTCSTVMNTLTWIVCARIVITWLKRWKVVRRTHAWWKVWEKHPNSGKTMETCWSTTTPVSQDSVWSKPVSREDNKLNIAKPSQQSKRSGSSTRFSVQSLLNTPN